MIEKGNMTDAEYIAVLEKEIRKRDKKIDKLEVENECLRKDNHIFLEALILSKHKIFGASSEHTEFEDQQSFFNEAEQEYAEKTEEPVKKDVKGYVRKSAKTKRDEIIKNIETEVITCTIPENEQICPRCGSKMKVVGKKYVREEVELIPAKLVVKKYYSNTYGCKKCEKKNMPVFLHGFVPAPVLPHSLASASTAAWVIYQKYVNAVPLYRQEKDWKQYGVEITRATMANWVIRNSEAFFLPMYEYFHRKLLERGFAMADETPLQVLHEPERRAQTKSYMWLFRSGEDGGPPIILYKYSETRAGDNAVDFLHGFKGYLMCDGYSGYNKVPDAKRTACWAHIRRYLTDAITKGKALDYTQPSVQGMLYINQLFHLEDVIRSKYSSFDAITKARLEKEKPVVEGFLSWLDQQNPIRGSRMDKAVTYIQNRRSYLTIYLEDGRCSFSNNLSENAIRPFTVGRKNWLFCDTPNGAQASAIVYTMVEMAKANGVNVYHYLTYLLEKLPDDRMRDDELELLAPWNETVKAEIERRANESNQSYVNCQGAPATEK